MKQNIAILALAIANLISSFGGGTILGKGMGILASEPLLAGDSMLAFLLGSVLVILFGKNYINSPYAKYASFVAAALAFLAWVIVIQGTHLQGPIAWLFFALLLGRFAFYYFSRCQRADRVSLFPKFIPVIEMSFYVGVFLGLVFWQRIEISLAHAFLLDVVVLVVAGLLDSFSFLPNPTAPNQTTRNFNSKQFLQWKTVGHLWGAICLFTLGCQSVSMAFVEHVRLNPQANAPFAQDILGILYMGAALAAFSYTLLKGHWSSYHYIKDLSAGQLVLNTKKGRISISVQTLALANLFLLVLGMIGYTTQFLGKSSILACLMGSTFLLEWLLLALVGRLAEWSKVSNQKGLVLYAVAFMGLSAATGLKCLLHISLNIDVLVGAGILFTFAGVGLMGNHATIKEPIPHHPGSPRYV